MRLLKEMWAYSREWRQSSGPKMPWWRIWRFKRADNSRRKVERIYESDGSYEEITIYYDRGRGQLHIMLPWREGKGWP